MILVGGFFVGVGGYQILGGYLVLLVYEVFFGGVEGLVVEVYMLEWVIFEVKWIIVGQDQLVEWMFVGLLFKGYVLFEGVFGVVKMLVVEIFVWVVGGIFLCIQFILDLVFIDIIGMCIYW